jgi:hypothetical protein
LLLLGTDTVTVRMERFDDGTRDVEVFAVI